MHKGTVVLATVKGDVHDIGKNLVDIILTNNGYKVVNLGIKQPLANILAAAEEHRAHAVGMSGLLVKSTVIMRENMLEMSRMGLDVPVMLGGAALTRQYVEEDCVKAYQAGRVAYARDAFDGLHLMDRIVSGGFDAYLAERQAQQSARPKRRKPARTLAAVNGEAPAIRPVDLEETRVRRNELSRGIEMPQPPFWGPRVLDDVQVAALVPYLNENMLFQFHWGYKKDGRSLPEFLAWATKELKPILVDLLEETETERVFQPQAVYGYWPAAGAGNDVILFDPAAPEREVARFALPRQDKKNGLCIADFLRDAAEPGRDVLGLQIVTVGQRASDVAREWFAADRYNDYVRLHGLGVELAEALAEYVHRRIRAELGFAHQDARERAELLEAGLSRLALLLRLSRLPEPRRPAPAARAARRLTHRGRAVRRGPAVARAVDLGDRPAPPPGALFQRVKLGQGSGLVRQRWRLKWRRSHADRRPPFRRLREPRTQRSKAGR